VNEKEETRMMSRRMGDVDRDKIGNKRLRIDTKPRLSKKEN
jgi:hypothetical protein